MRQRIPLGSLATGSSSVATRVVAGDFAGEEVVVAARIGLPPVTFVASSRDPTLGDMGSVVIERRDLTE